MHLEVERIHVGAALPSRNDGDNGFDLKVVADDSFQFQIWAGDNFKFLSEGKDGRTTKSMLLGPGERHLFSTGLKIALPDSRFAMIRGRSGLANKFGIAILGGLIDESYRGEWKVILHNTGKDNLIIQEGDKIAQFVIVEDNQYEIMEVKELSVTNRGESGFGSTGV